MNPYGWTKLVVEQVLADYARAYAADSAALRYFNAAGSVPEIYLIPPTVFWRGGARWGRAGRRAGDPPRLVANATKAREVLGWVPEYKELTRIVETAWRYMERG